MTNQAQDAQTALVSEVKAALGRALALPESQIKHVKVQALASLICTMIDSCPSTVTQQQGPFRTQQARYLFYFLRFKKVGTLYHNLR